MNFEVLRLGARVERLTVCRFVVDAWVVLRTEHVVDDVARCYFPRVVCDGFHIV